MQFSKELRDDVLAGEITVSLIPFADITEAHVRRAGEPDRKALRRRAAHAGPVDDGTLLYRVEFHLVRR